MVDLEDIHVYPQLGLVSICGLPLYSPDDRTISLNYFSENLELYSHLRDFMLEDGTLVYRLYTFINRSKVCIWPDPPRFNPRFDLAFAWDCSRQLLTIQAFFKHFLANKTTLKTIAAVSTLNKKLPHDLTLKIITQLTQKPI